MVVNNDLLLHNSLTGNVRNWKRPEQNSEYFTYRLKVRENDAMKSVWEIKSMCVCERERWDRERNNRCERVEMIKTNSESKARRKTDWEGGGVEGEAREEERECEIDREREKLTTKWANHRQKPPRSLWRKTLYFERFLILAHRALNQSDVIRHLSVQQPIKDG